MKDNLLKWAIMLKISKAFFCQTAILLLLMGLSFASIGATPQRAKIPTATPPIVIKGKVTDEKGEALIGVGIRLKSGGASTTTNLNGTYQISVADGNAVLVFTSVGFNPQEIKVGTSTNIDVVMHPDQKSLDEIVVVGYATQKKVDLTGAVSVVSGEELNKRTVTSPLSLLQGKAPGLQVVDNSGEPGNEGTTIRIRGFSTFTANADPLVVVDGIPLVGIGNLNQINPNDIETISVLKDAASASIYGSRAANGVILVTTKKGSSNGRINLDYTYNAGITTPTRLLHLVTNSVEYMNMYNTAAVRSLGPTTPQYSAATIAQYSPGGIYAGINTDWQDLIFSTVLTSNHYLSLNGTTNTTKYNISLGYVNQPGTEVGIQFKKYTFQLGLNTTVNKTIDMGVNVNMNYTYRITPAQGSNDTYLAAITQPPIFGPYTLDGSGNFTDTNASDPIHIFHNKNVFASALLSPFIQKTYNGILNTFIDIKILPGLVWETRGGINFQYQNTNNFRAQVHTYNYYTDVVGSDLDVGALGLTITDGSTINPVAYSQFSYHKNLGDHNFTLLAGGQYDYNYSDNLTGFRNGFLPYVTNLRQLGAGSTAAQTGNSSATEFATESLYGRLNYNYKERYLLEANGRFDGSSRFAPGNKWAFFPSISGAWRATQEPFVKKLNLTWLDEFKLKGSWGRLGNNNISAYPYQPTLSTGSAYPIDNSGSVTTAVQNPNLTDPTIRWETTESYDLGLESSYLNGKLNFTLDYYKKRTFDILRAQQISAYKGLGQPTVNSGIMQNRGFELSVGYNDRKGDFTYGITGGLDLNRNTLVKFGTTVIGGNTIQQEGHEYNQFYMYKWIGIFQSAAEVASSPTQPNSPKPGDLKYADINGDGVIDSRDRTYFPGFNPSFNYSFNLNFGYKQFDLTVFLYGVAGQKIYGNGFGIEPFQQNEPPLTSFRDAWTPTNPSQTIPALYIGGSAPAIQSLPSTYFLKDAAFLRVKNVQLGYNFSTKVSSKIGMKNLRVYVAADNLAVFTKYPELDPERTATTGSNGQFDTAPQNRIIEIGAKVRF